LPKVSISSMFYVRIFHTIVLCAAFSSYISALVIVWKHFRMKNACVKCWWNWQQESKNWSANVHTKKAKSQSQVNKFVLKIFHKTIFSLYCYFFKKKLETLYRVFPRFRQAKFADGVLILGSSQFTQLPRLPLKMMLNLKKVKIDSKIIILLC